MKFRKVIIFTGKRFLVPSGIQRIDHGATHGWQLRYGGTKLFSDFSSDGSGATAALERAKAELLRRIQTLPAPASLQRTASRNKTSDLPVGISGPIVRRRGNVQQCSFGVLLPRFGRTPLRRSVYIATENTYSIDKYQAALEKAITLRRNAELAYRREATKAKRAEAQALMRKAA